MKRSPFLLGALSLSLLTLEGACSTLMRGNEAACLEACRREGGSAQGTSPCEKGCRKEASKKSEQWRSGDDKDDAKSTTPSTSGSLGIFW